MKRISINILVDGDIDEELTRRDIEDFLDSEGYSWEFGPSEVLPDGD